MKDKRIRFDDKLYMTIFSFVASMLSLLVLIFEIDDIPIWEAVICCILFSLFLSGVFVFPKMGIHIYYRKEILKYFGPIKIPRPIIKLRDIKSVSFVETSKKRKKFFTDYSPTSISHGGFYNEPEYVYRNGKIYKFIIELKNGNTIVIPYYNMFKVRSKRRIYRQETHINKTIEELNQYLEHNSLQN